MDNADQIRASILGVLIKDARIHAGRSTAECAEVFGMPEEEFENIERGKSFPDMPFLEALAMYLHVPFEHFWGNVTLGGYPVSDFTDLLKSRRAGIGAQVQKLREDKGTSAKDLAKALKIKTGELAKIEDGSTELSISMAERIVGALDLSMRDLQDKDGASPLLTHEQQQKLIQEIDKMPEDLRVFVMNTSNQPYLKMAMNLSEMEVNKMRDFAEGILDITL